MSGVVARVRSVPTWQVTLGAALLVLGFLLVAQFRAEPARVQYTSQERPPLVETATQLQSRQDALKATILDLRTQISTLEASAATSNAQVAAIDDRLRSDRIQAGLVDLEGPGLLLQVEDSTQPVPPDAAAADYMVSASDLRRVVGELWLAGAEAVAVNGERITALSAMTDIGTSILLNGAYLQPPYQVTAIGPTDLYQRLLRSATFAQFVRARVNPFGIRFGVAQLDQAVVPAYAGDVALQYALPLASAAPVASPLPSAPPSPTPATSRAARSQAP